jgi:hypothetical protein
VHVIANGQRMIRYEPVAISPNVIGGHFGNGVTAGVRGATIAGGGAAVNTDPDLPSEIPNLVTDHYGTVGGGLANRAGDGAGTTFDGALATVGGGRLNVASGFQSAIGGGLSNAASGAQSTVGGGSNNEAIGTYATVGGGTSNDAIGEHSAVAGGGFNVASGGYATVAGGQFNLAEGDHSFAAGYRAKALGNGSFSFADASEFDFSATTDNAFRVRATGGVIFVTDINLSGTPTWACLTTSGAGWTCASDRRLKQDLALLDGADVLARLARLPLYAWSPKGRNAHVRHYGPMAQDFMAAFGLGEDDTMIGMQDADGVALAAIQGLNAKLEQATSVIDALSARLQALEAWLAAAP